MPDTIYIIGHKNPDADAICSAIAYAAYKNATENGDSQYVPARCGNSNARIDAILRHFNTPLPMFLGDLTPRVKDMMKRSIIQTRIDSTCGESLELIDEHDVRALPVVDQDSCLKGLVSIFSLGEFFIPKLAEPKKMRHVHTSINDIVRVLRANPLHLTEPDRVEDLYVRVGAMDINSFGKFTDSEGILPNQSIIIVGNRYDIQQKAVQAGSRVLVATGNLDLDEDVVNMAKERGVCLMVSAWDSATTSWLIRSATRLEPMVEKKVPTFRAEEKVSQVRRKIAQAYSPLYCVTDESNRLQGIFSKTDLLKPVSKKIILVDHNEIGQAVQGAGECEIIEIIDHHRLGNPPTAQPIVFRNDVIGSTSSIIASIYRENDLTPPPQIAGLMMAGLISDTLNLQSPTTTPKDAQLLPWLAETAGCDIGEIAEIIFKSGSIIVSSQPLDVIKADLKIYDQDGYNYSVSQIEELGFANFWERSSNILEALEDYRNSEGLDFSALLVTDINKQNSLLLLRGSEDVVGAVSYPCIESIPHTFDLPGIVSRKKQLIPYFTTLLDSIGSNGS